LAPVVTINGEFYAGVTPKQINEIVLSIKKKEQGDAENN